MKSFKDLDWTKIISNGGYTFFTTLGAFFVKDGFTWNTEFLYPAVALSVVTAMIAIFRDMKEGAGEVDTRKYLNNKGQMILNKVLLF